MGFYGLLPALKPTAIYYKVTGQLVLTASGTAEEATTNIGFTSPFSLVCAFRRVFRPHLTPHHTQFH